jgi:hypothetical protein
MPPLAWACCDGPRGSFDECAPAAVGVGMWKSRAFCGISKRGGNWWKSPGVSWEERILQRAVGLFHSFHGASFPQRSGVQGGSFPASPVLKHRARTRVMLSKIGLPTESVLVISGGWTPAGRRPSVCYSEAVLITARAWRPDGYLRLPASSLRRLAGPSVLPGMHLRVSRLHRRNAQAKRPPRVLATLAVCVDAAAASSAGPAGSYSG